MRKLKFQTLGPAIPLRRLRYDLHELYCCLTIGVLYSCCFSRGWSRSQNRNQLAVVYNNSLYDGIVVEPFSVYTIDEDQLDCLISLTYTNPQLFKNTYSTSPLCEPNNFVQEHRNALLFLQRNQRSWSCIFQQGSLKFKRGESHAFS